MYCLRERGRINYFSVGHSQIYSLSRQLHAVYNNSLSFSRRLLAKHLSCALARWLGKEEFLVPHNVLDIVAAQTVIWTGIFFCPLLPVLGCVVIFLTFYIKKVKILSVLVHMFNEDVGGF